MSEKIIIKDISNYKYFSMTPHIIYEIGLKGNEIAVYGAIKRAAGENGGCSRSKATLAKNAGVCAKTIYSIIQKLCQINPILKKPLIQSTTRFSENGDQETNLIEIVDIWPENMNLFKENIGEVNFTPPQVTITRPPGNHYPTPQVTITSKEKPFKEKPFKKTTTTPTPSKGIAAVAVVSDEIKKTNLESLHQAENEAAVALKTWLDKEAIKIRKRKEGSYCDEQTFGQDWIIPLEIYENLIHKYGIPYFESQLKLMTERQKKFLSGFSKKGIDIPERYLSIACSKNYAESNKKKENL